MQRYKNVSGDSGVAGYENSLGGIVVKFVNGATYRYTHASAGKPAIETMQRLAKSGRGLSTYISQEKPDYAERVR